MGGFKKAVRTQAKARIAIAGPSGSGKTMTALKIARGLVGPGGKIAVIDTEKNSASLYADVTDFDTLDFAPPFQPRRYIKALELAEENGYDAIIVDSISHEWNGSGGVQEMVDAVLRRLKTSNTMLGWKEVTPQHNEFVDKLVRTDAHLIATVRSKTAYEIDKDDKGRTTVKKLGLAPIQREGLEFEFTVFADMDLNHSLTVTKSRMAALQDKTIHHPDESLGRKIAEWLGTAEALQPAQPEPGDAATGDGAGAQPSVETSPPVEEGTSTREGEGTHSGSPDAVDERGGTPSSLDLGGGDESADSGQGSDGRAPSEALTAEQELDEQARLVDLLERALDNHDTTLPKVIKASMGHCARANVSPPASKSGIKDLPLSVLQGIVRDTGLDQRLVGA